MKKERVQRLPYIVMVIDEFADLMATTGKELESTLARLAAMSRAIGIHMVLATQCPSLDVITGLIKANIPSRIAFMVANKFDSRIIIDAVGAEKLLGKGDMLLSPAWNPFPVRIQGAYIDEVDSSTFEGEPGNDPLFERALEIVMGQGKASASYIQRRRRWATTAPRAWWRSLFTRNRSRCTMGARILRSAASGGQHVSAAPAVLHICPAKKPPGRACQCGGAMRPCSMSTGLVTPSLFLLATCV